MSGILLGFLKLGKSTVVVEITGGLDRKSFEALKLDLASLARKHGLKLKRIAVKRGAKRKKKK